MSLANRSLHPRPGAIGSSRRRKSKGKRAGRRPGQPECAAYPQGERGVAQLGERQQITVNKQPSQLIRSSSEINKQQKDGAVKSRQSRTVVLETSAADLRYGYSATAIRAERLVCSYQLRGSLVVFFFHACFRVSAVASSRQEGDRHVTTWHLSVIAILLMGQTSTCASFSWSLEVVMLGLLIMRMCRGCAEKRFARRQ